MLVEGEILGPIMVYPSQSKINGGFRRGKQERGFWETSQSFGPEFSKGVGLDLATYWAHCFRMTKPFLDECITIIQRTHSFILNISTVVEAIDMSK